MATLAAIIGRLCIAALFILSGIAKLMDPAGTAQFIASNSTLPGTLAIPVAIFEIVAGVLLGLGFMTRLVAIVLAGFVALATLLFHYQITDPGQQQAASKNLAILGGLLMVFAYGQVSWRISTWKERARRHDAELAAARAEARADALQQTHPAAIGKRGLFSRRTVADRTDGDPHT
jgi:putative oxidoreductase